jgi:hypothetical protein
VLNSDRKSYRDDNVQQPGVTGLMPPEDNVLTFRPEYDVVRVQVTERINITVNGTGSYAYFIPPGGTNYGTFGVSVFGSIWYQWIEEVVASNGNMEIEVFGTHWTDFPEAPAGTNYGTMGFSVYGEHFTLWPEADAGTDYGTFSVDVYGSVFDTVVRVDAGTGTLTMDASMGNTSSYDLYNYILNGNVAIESFGTYFAAIVPYGDVGTLNGTYSVQAFGTHYAVTVFTEAGTLAGTYFVNTFGTYLETVVTTDAGTLNGTYSVETFGTALLVTEHGGTFSDFYGTYAVGAFGTYV